MSVRRFFVKCVSCFIVVLWTDLCLAAGFSPPLGGEFKDRTAGLCIRIFRSAKGLVVSPNPMVAEIKKEIGATDGIYLGYPADQVFNRTGGTMHTGRGYETRYVDSKKVSYPIEVGIVRAYLKSLEVPPQDLELLPYEQHYVLSRVRKHLLENPDEIKQLTDSVAGSEFPFSGKRYVFAGPNEVKPVDPSVDVSATIPTSRINGIVGSRDFEDGYTSLTRTEYQGNGMTGYSSPPVLEGQSVRIIFGAEKNETGYIDGKYVSAALPGHPIGSFLGSVYSQESVMGHIIEVQNGPNKGNHVLVPKEGVTFYYKR